MIRKVDSVKYKLKPRDQESVQSLNQITQKNASSSEQVSQNATELQNLAQELNSAIAFFKIK